MIEIDDATAAAFLKCDRFRYLPELQAIECDMPQREIVPLTLYADSAEPTAVAVVQVFPEDRVFAAVSNRQTTFLAELLGKLAEMYTTFTLAGFDQQIIDDVRELRPDQTFGEAKCWRNFVCTSPDAVPPVIAPIRLLTPEDREMFDRYALAVNLGRGHDDAFRCAVIDGGGLLFGVVEDGEITGHLWANREYEDVWVIDLIEVREDHRGRGLGTQLAAAFAREVLGRGEIPDWGSAGNEASERTAIKAGFTCCREYYCLPVTIP